MYAVIFRARVGQQDAEYSAVAARMRQLAMTQYGCLDFTSVTEGQQEVAVSYWHSLADIARWREDAEHLAAQAQGRQRWYAGYQVEVVEVVRQYGWPRATD